MLEMCPKILKLPKIYKKLIFLIMPKILKYCNKFADSVSQWKFTTLTVQYTILDYISQIFYKSNTRMTEPRITANTSTVF
jgi:hypothetical protein